MPFEVKTDFTKAMLKFDAFPPGVRDVLDVFITNEAGAVLGQIKGLAGGDVLQVITGKYLRSMKAAVRVTDKRVSARVGSRDPRAPLFEFGGTTPAREIVAKNAKALHFAGASVGELFRAHVHRPAIKYRPHQAIFQGFAQLKPEIQKGMVEAVESVVSGDV